MLWPVWGGGGAVERLGVRDERRARLEAWFAANRPARMDVSPLIPFSTMAELAEVRDGARAASIEGLMLKRADSPYVAGRVKGMWWKWKRDPLSIDAVMMYAQRGHGKRSSFYSDYTFAVWDGPPGSAERRLVPFAKAYSGLTDAEIAALTERLQALTVQKFGRYQQVRPEVVLEVTFDVVQKSARHKAGYALRFPRILRLRDDKPAAEVDTLAAVRALAGEGGDGAPTG